MSVENAIIEMLRILKQNIIYATVDFEKDLLRLVNTDIYKFVETFYQDIRRANLKQYNKHEILTLNKKQKEMLDGKALHRYEYRKSSNLRCIYLIQNENNMEEIILLCAFNEDGDKTKGKNSYKNNINRAIRIYLNIKES